MATNIRLSRLAPARVHAMNAAADGGGRDRAGTAGFGINASNDGLSIAIASVEEINRRTARKCINCCAFINDNNKNDISKVVFSVNLVQTPASCQALNGPNERKILMSAIQAMDTMFQVNSHPKLKETIAAGSLCHNCTKTFGAFFQLYVQFIACSQMPSPIRTLLQKSACIRRNLKDLLEDRPAPAIPKIAAISKPKILNLGPNHNPGPAPVTTSKPKPTTTTVARAELTAKSKKIIKQEPVSSVLKQLPTVVPKPKVLSAPRLLNAQDLASPRLMPIIPKTILLPMGEMPIPPPRLPKLKEGEPDPFLDVPDDDLESLLMSRGRKQQFTKVRDFDEPVFEEDPEVLSEEEALSAVSAVTVTDSISRSIPASTPADEEPEDESEEMNLAEDDDEDYEPSARKRRRSRVRKSVQKTDAKAKTQQSRSSEKKPEADYKVESLATSTRPNTPPPAPVQVKCDRCCELFEDPVEMDSHFDTHDEDETLSKWTCLICSCGFKDFELKSKHMLRAHLSTNIRTRAGKRGKESQSFQYGCGMCSLKFGVESDFKEHLVSVHLSCPHCVDDIFLGQEEINEHMDSHGANWMNPTIARPKTRSTAAIELEIGSEGSKELSVRVRDRDPQPCPICGKTVTRVGRHIEEVHKGHKRIPGTNRKIKKQSNAKSTKPKMTN